MRKTVYLSLGSNLGERASHLAKALAALEANGIHINALSAIYETAPRDQPNQPWFLNMAAAGDTALMPVQLLHVLLRIERDMGRIRQPNNRRGPRVIDIDILLYGSSVIATKALTVPHPRMLERRFALEPLLEIAPQLRHPQTRRPLHEYLAGTLHQKLRVKR